SGFSVPVYLSAIVFFVYYFVSCFFFFFSSRRRHTRCYRDWSSDVCSSDLGIAFNALFAARRLGTVAYDPRLTNDKFGIFVPSERSEERRVGKECGCRGGAED